MQDNENMQILGLDNRYLQIPHCFLYFWGLTEQDILNTLAMKA